LQKVKEWLWGVYISYDKNTGEQMNIEDSCHRFFAAERELVRGYRSDCVASGIEEQQRVGLARARETHPKTDTSFRQES
jgi:hypothetical protein